MEIPVYLFTGFLDSGKTKFIQETLEDPRFYENERTLVILCEEGEEEYEPSKFPSNTVFFHTIDDINDLTENNLESLKKKYRINRVIIEYNGMWLLDNLYQALPKNWLLYEQIVFADASTFITYNNNMRNLVGDKIKDCDMIVFNRVKLDEDIMPYHKIVRSLSRRANITYEYVNGEIQCDDIEDPLPFDLNADIIEIDDNDYALWYRDLIEDTDKYNGKMVKFKGIVVVNPQLDNGSIIIGRHIMTCCADDITFGGLVAKIDINHEFETKDWAHITAKISVEHNKVYETKGPVLYSDNIEHTIPPKQELATFM